MNVLIISPHMDDEALGLGGIISRYTEEEHTVRVVFAANRIYNHQFEEEKNTLQEGHALKAKQILGYTEAVFLRLPDERLDTKLQELIIGLEKQVDRFRSDTVFIPFKGDNNQDHRAVFDAARIVLRPSATPFVSRIYMYEVPSSTDQSPPLAENLFMPNCYIDISDHIDKKIAACNCYENESRPYPNPRSEEGLRVLAKKRGLEMGIGSAEALMSIREVWK